jgi:hypothetical protein
VETVVALSGEDEGVKGKELKGNAFRLGGQMVKNHRYIRRLGAVQEEEDESNAKLVKSGWCSSFESRLTVY